ncbi:hypothetical protein M513_07879 [Trichuris suis]|uniref:Uncharacterized protein n=1 Tax=Trichuris suis TaxID=68888 RepID=A0A085M233_9BILA|nr:hypothetical protein M513_07879 [Trichuris suis]
MSDVCGMKWFFKSSSNVFVAGDSGEMSDHRIVYADDPMTVSNVALFLSGSVILFARQKNSICST